MSAGRRTARDARRRSLGQNFLNRSFADWFVDQAGLNPGDLVVEIGAGAGALTLAMARRGVDVIAVEVDPVWASRLASLVRARSVGRVRVVNADFLSFTLPRRPFRVLGCLPFGATTAILRRLLDRPELPLQRADLIVQWEVARKRGGIPSQSLISATWAPWWELQLGPRVPAAMFRPVPSVDAGVLVVTRRVPPLLPVAAAGAYAAFVRAAWPFEATSRQSGNRRRSVRSVS